MAVNSRRDAAARCAARALQAMRDVARKHTAIDEMKVAAQ